MQLHSEAQGPGHRSSAPPHVVVVGAGAFGGWTALSLRRRGARVTLLDAWGPGNPRASSGGETRILRATYTERIYVDMAIEAMRLWQENEARWRRPLYRRTGALWMSGKDDTFQRAALPHLKAAGVDYETLTIEEAARRYPVINFEGIDQIILEKEAGYLRARRACQIVLESFIEEGGAYRPLAVEPGVIVGGRMRAVRLSDQSSLVADQYVFACGPWLGKLFPDVIGERLRPSRQEIFFFGTPAGDTAFSDDRLPIWLDHGPPRFYGIPGNEGRGFKIGDDTRGSDIDPTTAERLPTPEVLQAARRYLAMRFPALRDAPLLEARVCQYENTKDNHFIIDRHPAAENVWLIGGGSGHGFKHGPAVGLHVAERVLGEKAPDPCFLLSRWAV